MALRLRNFLLLRNSITSRPVVANTTPLNFRQIRFARTKNTVKSTKPVKPAINVTAPRKVPTELSSSEKEFQPFEGDIDSVCNLIQERADSGQPVSCKIYSKLFKFLAQSNRFNQIEHFFTQMLSRNVTRDIGVYNTILNILENTKNPAQHSNFLFMLYEQIIKDKLIPDFAKLLHLALLIKNKQFSTRLLTDMQNLNIEHTKAICNHLVQIYEDDPENMFQVWDEMREKKYVPNNYSYAVIIQHFIRKHDFATAIKHFRNMRTEGVFIDIHIYNAILYVMATVPQYHRDVIPTMQDLLHSKLVPNVSTFKALMAFYYNLNNEEKLREMWEKMEEKGVKPNAETCYYLIDLLSQKLDMANAVISYEKMKSKGIVPTLPILASITLGMIKNKDLKTLAEWKKEAEKYAQWSEIEALLNK